MSVSYNEEFVRYLRDGMKLDEYKLEYFAEDFRKSFDDYIVRVARHLRGEVAGEDLDINLERLHDAAIYIVAKLVKKGVINLDHEFEYYKDGPEAKEARE